MNNHEFPRNSMLKYLILGGLITAQLLSACSAAAPDSTEEPIPISTVQEMPDTTPSPEVTENPFGEWTEYINEPVNFRYLYPSAWFGPEVDESEGSLRLEVGSDVVYPYGTSREDQITTVPDSYYITNQYFENI